MEIKKIAGRELESQEKEKKLSVGLGQLFQKLSRFEAAIPELQKKLKTAQNELERFEKEAAKYPENERPPYIDDQLTLWEAQARETEEEMETVVIEIESSIAKALEIQGEINKISSRKN